MCFIVCNNYLFIMIDTGMLRKLRFLVRKTHSDVTKGELEPSTSSTDKPRSY